MAGYKKNGLAFCQAINHKQLKKWSAARREDKRRLRLSSPELQELEEVEAAHKLLRREVWSEAFVKIDTDLSGVGAGIRETDYDARSYFGDGENPQEAERIDPEYPGSKLPWEIRLMPAGYRVDQFYGD